MSEAPGDFSHSGHVLVVDDEPFIRNAFKLYLETHGFNVSCAAGGDEALEMFRDERRVVDLILLDLVLPGYQGLDLLRQFKIERSLVEVIIATGCGSMNSAIEALRLGAFDYVTKPIVDFDRDLLSVVQKAMASRAQKLNRLAPSADHADIDALRRTVRLHNDLETLAASLVDGPGGASAMAPIESFLARHFAIVGGVVSEHSVSAVTFRHRWGVLADWIQEDFTPPDPTEADCWRPMLRSTARWEPIRMSALVPDAEPENASTEDALELLRIPLEEELETGGRSKSLFIFRHREEDTDPPECMALLAVIVNTALARSVGLAV